MQLNLFNPENSNTLSPPAYVYFEYFFLISPGEKIKKDVVFLKKKLHAFIGLSKQNLHSIPHLSLLLIRERMSCDNLIINKTLQTLKGAKRFNIEVNGASVFNHTRTKSLVLNVERSAALQHIFRALHSEFVFPPPEEMVDDFKPHITIGRSIPFSDFYKVVHPLSEFHYNESFHCDQITILKRTVTEIGGKKEYSAYTPIFEVPFV
jgi:2'-5' RNA ligase